MSRRVSIYGKGGVSIVPSTDFIMLVKTDNAGTSGTNQFTIPTSGGGYNYEVETTEQLLTGQTGNVTLTWASAGTYVVKVRGTFPRIYFNNTGDRQKLLEVQNWGNIAWKSMLSAFYGCSNMQLTANDIPNLSSLVGFHMRNMFRSCTIFNKDISNWNVSNIRDMHQFILNATSFNQNLGNWNLANSLSIGLNGGISANNYTDTIVSWANKSLIGGGIPSSVSVNGNGRTFDTSRSGGANFANAGAARTYLTTTAGWTISGDTVI